MSFTGWPSTPPLLFSYAAQAEITGPWIAVLEAKTPEHEHSKPTVMGAPAGVAPVEGWPVLVLAVELTDGAVVGALVDLLLLPHAARPPDVTTNSAAAAKWCNRRVLIGNI